MLIIWGTRLYGKVDEVPGMFHVATRFFHLWYIPLIPLGSTLVLNKTEKGWRGVDVGLSGKSLLLAWARVGLIVGACFTGITGFALVTDNRPAIAIGIVMLLLAAIMLGAAIASWAMKSVSQARYERAVQLAEKIGMTEEGLVLIELAYKRVSEEDAKATLEQLQADAAQMAELAKMSAGSVPATPPTAPPLAPPLAGPRIR